MVSYLTNDANFPKLLLIIYALCRTVGIVFWGKFNRKNTGNGKENCSEHSEKIKTREFKMVNATESAVAEAGAKVSTTAHSLPFGTRGGARAVFSSRATPCSPIDHYIIFQQIPCVFARFA